MRDRNKQIKKKRRIRQLKTRLSLVLILILLLLILLEIFIWRERVNKSRSGGKQHTTSISELSISTGNTNSDAKKDEEKTETAEERLARVKKEATENQYPADIIELLDKNPETVDFVEDYLQKKDDPVATTIGDDYKEGQVPKLYQWDERWGYQKYGTSFVAASGCGPTCLSMVLSTIKKDPSITPAAVASLSEQLGEVDSDNNTMWLLLSDAATTWGVSSEEGLLGEDQVNETLNSGKLIICSVGPGDFTKIGHFIVLVSYKDGQVEVRDPFNTEHTERTWTYADIASQIVEMWTFSGL